MGCILGKREGDRPNPEVLKETRMLEITDIAKQKILDFMESKDQKGSSLRVAIRGRGPHGFQYEMGFVSPENYAEDDIVLDLGGLSAVIDPETVPNLKGSTLDYIDDPMQSGYRVDNPNPLWTDPISQKVQEVLDAEVNPGIASHGGHVSLEEVRDGIAYVKLGGGCQGCGMAGVTLTQGIVVSIKEGVEEITDVVDVTNHEAGSKPYYEKAEA
jgi:Fe/S biogenesis protein NfuA